LMGEMLARGYLALDDGPYPVLKLTHACLPVLQGKETLEILEVKETAKAKSRRGSGGGGDGAARAGRSDGDSGDPVLFGRLRALRKEIAQRQGVPPYMVFSDKT